MSIAEAASLHGEEARRVVEGYLADHAAEWLSEQVEFRDMTQPEPMQGRTEVTAFLHRFYNEVFSDARADAPRLTAEAGRVVAEWTFRGRHTGSLMGETPTGREVELPMACSYDVQAGEISAARLYYDTATLVRQVTPDAGMPTG